MLTAEQFDAVLAGIRAGAPGGPRLELTAAVVAAFVAGVRAGEFDLTAYAA